jgi:hypothetical protein
MTKKCLPATGTARRGTRTLPIPTPNSFYALRHTLTRLVRVPGSSPFSTTPEEVSLWTVRSMASTGIPPYLFDIQFGHNPFGIILTMPSDMMHVYESGTLKQVCQFFCLPMFKLALTIWWKTYISHSGQCLEAALTSFAPTFVVEPLT